MRGDHRDLRRSLMPPRGRYLASICQPTSGTGLEPDPFDIQNSVQKSLFALTSTLAKLAAGLREEGLPALMLIVGEGEERWYGGKAQ